MDRRRILITGGKGYIGANLEKHLSAEHDVDICDYHTDLPLAEQLNSSHIEKYDGIVHLAALSGIIACEENPEKAMRRNLFTAMNVFLEAGKFKIPTVFTSTQAAKNPRTSSYAMMKRLCELMAEDLNNKGARITILRLTNVYGGEGYLEKKNTVIKQFVKRYSENLVFEIDGDGSQKRDFIHVEDVCIFIEKALIAPYTATPVDIGTGVGTSIDEIADMFNGEFPISKKEDKYPREYMGEKGRSCGVSSSIADNRMALDIFKYQAFPRMQEYINQQKYLIKGY